MPLESKRDGVGSPDDTPEEVRDFTPVRSGVLGTCPVAGSDWVFSSLSARTFGDLAAQPSPSLAQLTSIPRFPSPRVLSSKELRTEDGLAGFVPPRLCSSMGADHILCSLARSSSRICFSTIDALRVRDDVDICGRPVVGSEKCDSFPGVRLSCAAARAVVFCLARLAMVFAG